MTELRRRPVEVTDAPEHRAIPIDTFEVGDSDENTLTLTGYASTFQPYEMYGGPANGQGWIEQIDRGAFERTLKEGPDLHLLINHEGLPLARTKSGTLDLSVDDHGLHVVARLDRSDPDVQRLEPKMRRGDMDEMSFAFRVKAQEWDSTPEFKDDPQALRKITEVSLHKGDVSVVNWGANPSTHAELKSVSEALKVLAECDEKELVEVRSETLGKARAKLAALDGEVIRAELVVDSPTGTFLDGVISRADSDDDAASLIAALDAALDEVCALIADVDPKSLPEEVAQALDLVHGAETIVDKLMEVTGVYDPDGDERMSADESEKREMEMREAVSDHAWDFPQSAYSIGEWRHACLIDTGKGDPDSKSRYKEPVREPDGTLNRRGVHAAAGRLDQVEGITDAQRTMAAKKLVSLYRDQLKEDPPPHLLDMAHERSLTEVLTERVSRLWDAVFGQRAASDEQDDSEESEEDESAEEEEEENSAPKLSLQAARAQEGILSLAEARELGA